MNEGMKKKQLICYYNDNIGFDLTTYRYLVSVQSSK